MHRARVLSVLHTHVAVRPFEPNSEERRGSRQSSRRLTVAQACRRPRGETIAAATGVLIHRRRPQRGAAENGCRKLGAPRRLARGAWRRGARARPAWQGAASSQDPYTIYGGPSHARDQWRPYSSFSCHACLSLCGMPQNSCPPLPHTGLKSTDRTRKGDKVGERDSACKNTSLFLLTQAFVG